MDLSRLISPPSIMVHLTDIDDNTTESRRYYGAPQGTNTNKSITDAKTAIPKSTVRPNSLIKNSFINQFQKRP